MHGADTPNLTRVAECLNRPERPEIDAPGVTYHPHPQDRAARSLPNGDVTRDTRMRMSMATRDCGSEIKSCHCKTN